MIPRIDADRVAFITLLLMGVVCVVLYELHL